ncbi:MAG: hypothetical protein NPIRA02_38360 [Nitrospirales bacterium]|nr:MAG: hypothetical protein NPIRA02_38360 [Nitrospirales bacterium]
MPVNLSIKNVPDRIVKRLRRRALKHHRSLQGELLSIIEECVEPKHSLTTKEVWEEVQRTGLKTPRESVTIIRQDRDGR